MKILLGLLLIALCAIACNQENYLLYESESRLQFGGTVEDLYKNEAAQRGDTLINFTFIYSDESVVEDTVWFHLHTQGNLSDMPRPFCLEQVQIEGVANAVPDVHYKSFDNPEVKNLYVIPANAAYLKVPIIVKRDVSLSDTTVVLHFKVVANEYFQPGDPDFIWREVTISNRYVRCSKWMDAYVGSWGEEKMKFMIEVSGLKWDNDCFTNGLSDGSLPYWSMKFKEELLKRNEKVGTPLKEKDGTIVVFP